jgi:hypothetical protein
MAGYPSNVGTITVYSGDTFTQTFNFLENDAAMALATDGWTDWTAHYRKTTDAREFVSFAVSESNADSGEISLQHGLATSNTRKPSLEIDNLN